MSTEETGTPLISTEKTESDPGMKSLIPRLEVLTLLAATVSILGIIVLGAYQNHHHAKDSRIASLIPSDDGRIGHRSLRFAKIEQMPADYTISTNTNITTDQESNSSSSQPTPLIDESKSRQQQQDTTQFSAKTTTTIDNNNNNINMTLKLNVAATNTKTLSETNNIDNSKHHQKVEDLSASAHNVIPAADNNLHQNVNVMIKTKPKQYIFNDLNNNDLLITTTDRQKSKSGLQTNDYKKDNDNDNINNNNND